MLSELASLWLPIVVSAVVLFVVSAMAWMVMPHHKKEWGQVPNEDAVLDRLRADVPPGQYMFPHCPTPKAMEDPAVKARMEKGPYGVLTVWPGMPSMGGNMAKTFVFYMVVGLFIAYLAAVALEPGAEYLAVFRVTGVAALLGYAAGGIPHAIWFGRSGHSIATDAIDAVVYALLTAGIFAWLWPGA